MHQNGYVGRKIRLPKLKSDPAIVIAAFGSTTRAKAALDRIEAKIKDAYPDREIFWAYTSEIIRKKLKLPSLQETLAKVEAAGYRKAVVQPLHVFPGTEYQQLAETCSFFPGLRVFPGETLLHRWDFVKEILGSVETDFIDPEEGLNILAIHGTPLAADPVNIVYLGFERLVSDMYPNVITASVEGVPDHGAVFSKIQQEGLAARYRRVRIIPMMYFAGLHVEEDLMGDEDSWRRALEDMGFEVECLTLQIQGKTYFKGLAHYPEVNEGFMSRLDRALELSSFY